MTEREKKVYYIIEEQYSDGVFRPQLSMAKYYDEDSARNVMSTMEGYKEISECKYRIVRVTEEIVTGG